MPIDKTPEPPPPEQQIKALHAQLEEVQEKARFSRPPLSALRKDYGVRVVKEAFGKALSQDLVKGLSVKGACQPMGLGQRRQVYYRGRRREADRLASAQAVVEVVREQRMRQPRLGTRKLHPLLQEPLQRQDLALGRDAMSTYCAMPGC